MKAITSIEDIKVGDKLIANFGCGEHFEVVVDKKTAKTITVSGLVKYWNHYEDGSKPKTKTYRQRKWDKCFVSREPHSVLYLC